MSVKEAQGVHGGCVLFLLLFGGGVLGVLQSEAGRSLLGVTEQPKPADAIIGQWEEIDWDTGRRVPGGPEGKKTMFITKRRFDSDGTTAFEQGSVRFRPGDVPSGPGYARDFGEFCADRTTRGTYRLVGKDVLEIEMEGRREQWRVSVSEHVLDLVPLGQQGRVEHYGSVTRPIGRPVVKFNAR